MIHCQGLYDDEVVQVLGCLIAARGSVSASDLLADLRPFRLANVPQDMTTEADLLRTLSAWPSHFSARRDDGHYQIAEDAAPPPASLLQLWRKIGAARAETGAPRPHSLGSALALSVISERGGSVATREFSDELSHFALTAADCASSVVLSADDNAWSAAPGISMPSPAEVEAIRALLSHRRSLLSKLTHPSPLYSFLLYSLRERGGSATLDELTQALAPLLPALRNHRGAQFTCTLSLLLKRAALYFRCSGERITLEAGRFPAPTGSLPLVRAEPATASQPTSSQAPVLLSTAPLALLQTQTHMSEPRTALPTLASASQALLPTPEAIEVAVEMPAPPVHMPPKGTDSVASERVCASTHHTQAHHMLAVGKFRGMTHT